VGHPICWFVICLVQTTVQTSKIGQKLELREHRLLYHGHQTNSLFIYATSEIQEESVSHKSLEILVNVSFSVKVTGAQTPKCMIPNPVACHKVANTQMYHVTRTLHLSITNAYNKVTNIAAATRGTYKI